MKNIIILLILFPIKLYGQIEDLSEYGKALNLVGKLYIEKLLVRDSLNLGTSGGSPTYIIYKKKQISTLHDNKVLVIAIEIESHAFGTVNNGRLDLDEAQNLINLLKFQTPIPNNIIKITFKSKCMQNILILATLNLQNDFIRIGFGVNGDIFKGNDMVKIVETLKKHL